MFIFSLSIPPPDGFGLEFSVSKGGVSGKDNLPRRLDSGENVSSRYGKDESWVTWVDGLLIRFRRDWFVGKLLIW